MKKTVTGQDRAGVRRATPLTGRWHVISILLPAFPEKSPHIVVSEQPTNRQPVCETVLSVILFSRAARSRAPSKQNALDELSTGGGKHLATRINAATAYAYYLSAIQQQRQISSGHLPPLLCSTTLLCFAIRRAFYLFTFYPALL